MTKAAGKAAEKDGGTDIIKLADINRMPTEYERKVLDKVPDKAGYFTLAAHGASETIQYSN